MAVDYNVNGSTYTSINAACAAVESSHDYGSDGMANINVSITTQDTTPVTVDGASAGTASSSAHIRIEATSAAKHSGTFSSSKQRVESTSTSAHTMQINESWVHLKYLQVNRQAGGTSYECIRVNSGADNVLIEKCVIIAYGTTDHDCVYTGNWDVANLNIFDCNLQGGGNASRSCVQLQPYTASNGNTQNAYIEHCTMTHYDGNAADEGGIVSYVATGNTVTISAYNNLIRGSGTASAEAVNDFDSGTHNWSGQGNIGDDTSITSLLGATNNTNSATFSDSDVGGTDVLVTDDTDQRENNDFQLLDGTSSTDVAVAYAISGATRDSRIDLTKDITDNARPTAFASRDVGCFQVAGWVDPGGGPTAGTLSLLGVGT